MQISLFIGYKCIIYFFISVRCEQIYKNPFGLKLIQKDTVGLKRSLNRNGDKTAFWLSLSAIKHTACAKTQNSHQSSNSLYRQTFTQMHLWLALLKIMMKNYWLVLTCFFGVFWFFLIDTMQLN